MSAGGPPLLALERVTAHYGNLQALFGVNLLVRLPLHAPCMHEPGLLSWLHGAS
jgi:hypothetical protein